VNELSIVHIYPTVLGLYGDRGNMLVLAHRARARGFGVTAIIVNPGDPVPETADIYLLGGAEDLAQVKAVELLRADRCLQFALRFKCSAYRFPPAARRSTASVCSMSSPFLVHRERSAKS
jgi:CobQ-like glutamine amidotransferase family enzyme